MIRSILIALVLISFSSIASANYVGSEVQYFNPTPDNMDFFTVHSSRTLPQGTFKTTLFFDHAENIHYSNQFENTVTQAQLGFAVGMTDRMSFSVVGSGILNYDDEVGGAYTTDDITHIRAGVKYRFCDCDRGGFAVVANVGFGLMDPDLFVGDDNDFGASVTFVYDKLLTDTVRFGANLGYRYRNSEDARGPAPSAAYGAAFPVSRDGSDVLASVGLNFVLNQKWTATTEVYMSLPADQFFDFTVDNDTYDQKGAEVLLGANYSLSDNMDIGFGGTVGVFSEAQNADWRVFLGMGYAFGGASEDAGFNLSGNGSAPKAPAPVVEEAPVKIEDAPVKQSFDITAKFVSGSTTLTGGAKNQLDIAGTKLRSGGDYRMIFVEGHTDSAGRAESNKTLSEKRAEAVKNYLVKVHRIDVNKIQSVGFGETTPIADNSTSAGRAKNRRVVIKVK